VIPFDIDTDLATLGIPSLPCAFSLSGCCALPSLVDLGRPGDAWPTRDRADLTILARLACVLAHPCHFSRRHRGSLTLLGLSVKAWANSLQPAADSAIRRDALVERG
jgi:uncharacterized protein with GYD domain